MKIIIFLMKYSSRAFVISFVIPFLLSVLLLCLCWLVCPTAGWEERCSMFFDSSFCCAVTCTISFILGKIEDGQMKNTDFKARVLYVSLILFFVSYLYFLFKKYELSSLIIYPSCFVIFSYIVSRLFVFKKVKKNCDLGELSSTY